jgi:hypothetical protein
MRTVALVLNVSLLASMGLAWTISTAAADEKVLQAAQTVLNAGRDASCADLLADAGFVKVCAEAKIPYLGGPMLGGVSGERALVLAPNDRHANLYKALWLREAGRAREAPDFLAKATELPGNLYLGALDGVARNQALWQPEYSLLVLVATLREATFRGEGDPGLGLMQPGCFISPTRPLLLLAILDRMRGKTAEAEDVLEKLVSEDPSLIEARMLRGDADCLKTLTECNKAGATAAEGVLAALRAGRWEGIPRPSSGQDRGTPNAGKD